MSDAQRIIKALAIALAIFLIVCIIGGILSVAALIGGLSNLQEAATGEQKDYAVSADITGMQLEIGAADMTIQTGSRFRLESNLKNLTVKERNGTLVITEKSRTFSGNHNHAVLTLTVPEGFVFQTLQLQSGAGRLTADTLSTRELDLKLGAGEAQIGQLNATNRSDIEGGAGKVTIRSGQLHDLDLDMGVGELELTAQITGDSELNYGVGKSSLTLTGAEEDYWLTIDKGIGSVSLNGEQVKAGKVYGSGPNRIDIECGIGEVQIAFSK